MLSLLLLQSSPDIQFRDIIAVVALGWAAWNWWRKEAREDGLTNVQRIKKVETIIANHEERMTGFQQQHERAGEKFTSRCDELEKQVAPVPGLRESVVRMEIKIEENGKTVEKMDRKVDLLLSILQNRQHNIS